MQDAKRILYIIDDINYSSGAQKATALQIQQLNAKARVEIFTLTYPTRESAALFHNVTIHTLANESILVIAPKRFQEVLKSSIYSVKQKLAKCCFAVCLRVGIEHLIWQMFARNELADLVDNYDAICVVSEASKLRSVVANSKCKKKIQWIHTDYAQWRNFSEWAISTTKSDGSLYQKYDVIICLTDISKKTFTQIHPHLLDKVQVIGNLVDIDGILNKSKEPCVICADKKLYNIITVGRLEHEKAYGRILDICAQLKREGLKFHWYIVGDGSQKATLLTLWEKLSLQDVVTFTGQLKNPYPLMVQCNLFALLSHYEGLPVTIDEAQTLGIPVIATKVGGIPTQVVCNDINLLVNNSYESIYDMLTQLIARGLDAKSDVDFTIESYRDRNENTLRLLMDVFLQ